MPKLSIVIPAKNEEKRIAKTLQMYGSYFEKRQSIISTEIIVVVNGTTDATSQVVDKYLAKYSFIKKLVTPYDSGKGGAVSYGFKTANGDYIGFTDADGAISPSEYLKLFSFLDETPWLDGALGKREDSLLQISFKRRFLMKVYNLYTKLFFQLPYEDTQCGAKIFKKKVAKDIAAKLSNTGWSFDVNLLLISKHLNYRLVEFPVSWAEKEGSKFSLLTALLLVPLAFLKLKYRETGYKVFKSVAEFLNLPKDLTRKEVKNILIFAWRDIKHPEMGGSEVYIHEVAKRLVENYSVTLFTSNPGNLDTYDEIDGVKIIRKGGFITVYFWAIIYYFLFLRSFADFVIDVENGIPFFTPLFCFKPKVLLVHHLHKLQWFKQFSFPLATVGYTLEAWLMPFIYKFTKIVTVSPSTLIELKEFGFFDRNIYLGYNSIPAKVGGYYAKSATPLLAYVGRIKSYKRLEMAIRALDRLKTRYPDIKLIVGGRGDHEEALKGLVAQLNLDKYVEFAGFISEKKKWEILQKAWVFVMPSMKEGWGITIIEAASCATPTVGFNVPGVRDAVRDSQTGYLALNQEDFIERIDLLLKDYAKRSEFGKLAKTWSGLFSWKETAFVFTQVIKSVSKNESFLDTKIYPWELDLRSEALK